MLPQDLGKNHSLQAKLVARKVLNKLLSTQFSFRKHRSCYDNLVILATEIHTSFVRKASTVSLFLDLSNVFDDVNPSILTFKLSNMGLLSAFCSFVYNLTHRRNVQFAINGTLSDTFHSHKGVPQGSILSSILFNSYIAKLKEHIDSCEILQYADDIAIFSNHRQIEIALTNVEKAANQAFKFLSDKGLIVCPSKSSLITFTTNISIQEYIQ